MTNLKSLALGLAAFTTFALASFGAASPASAIIINDGCTSNSECAPSQYCDSSGVCMRDTCSPSYYSNEGQTNAVFDSWPGDYIVVTGSDQDVWAPESCYADGYDSSCGTSYTSYAKPGAPACNTNACTWQNSCSFGSDCNAQIQFRHGHLVRSGKYRVRSTGQQCAYDGGIIAEIVPCNC